MRWKAKVLATSSGQPADQLVFPKRALLSPEAHRYRQIAQRTDRVYVLAAPETDFTNSSD